MLKNIGMFMVNFDFKQTDTSTDLLSLSIKCANCKKNVYCSMKKIENKDHIIVFIKSIMFQSFGV